MQRSTLPPEVAAMCRPPRTAEQPSFGFLALVMVIAFLALLALTWPSPAPQASPQALKQAAINARVCPGMHAEWADAKTVQCLPERAQ